MTKTGINVSGPGKLFVLAFQIIVFTAIGGLVVALGAAIGSNWGEEGAHNGMEVVLFAFYGLTWITWGSKMAFFFESTSLEQMKR